MPTSLRILGELGVQLERPDRLLPTHKRRLGHDWKRSGGADSRERFRITAARANPTVHDPLAQPAAFMNYFIVLSTIQMHSLSTEQSCHHALHLDHSRIAGTFAHRN